MCIVVVCVFAFEFVFVLARFTWLKNAKHYFLFDSFFYGFLQRRRWDVKFQETSQMLKEHCGCTTERIILGKSRPTVTIIDSFEKKVEDYKPKQFKPKDNF